MGQRQFWVHILTSASGNAMYIGITNNLENRVHEHRTGKGSIFAKQYRVTRLVYAEEDDNPTDAIARENNSRVGAGNARMSWYVRSIPTFAI